MAPGQVICTSPSTQPSLTVTGWNLAIAAGGGLGGLLLARWGPHALPWALLVLLLIALAITVRARRHGFPR